MECEDIQITAKVIFDLPSLFQCTALGFKYLQHALQKKKKKIYKEFKVNKKKK